MECELTKVGLLTEIKQTHDGQPMTTHKPIRYGVLMLGSDALNILLFSFTVLVMVNLSMQLRMVHRIWPLN